MQNPKPSVFFDQERAASYDRQRAKMAPMKDALHFLTRMVFSDLPDNARILCVGVGTGMELIDLAEGCPHWQFTAVEPAAPMLDICRQKAEMAGIASRCTFHEGYLDSLPESDAFDAATCILVSQFIMQPEERRNFFQEIAARLRPDGYLVNADLASDISTSKFKNLFEVWVRMLKYSDMPSEQAEKLLSSFGKGVAVLPPHEVESIIASSGFNAPTLFFQSILIHAWYAKAAGEARI